MASCINLQLPKVILKKSIILDMDHHKTYMYINFQQKINQNRANKSICKKNRKLHKFATTNSNFENIDYFRHASS